jgi:hypothetical protein
LLFPPGWQPEGGVSEASRRKWSAIGVGSVAAAAVIALYVAGTWALTVLVELLV